MIAKIKIKRDDIQHLEIYINRRRLTMDQIKQETGADIIINGGLYNSDWTACPILKVDGVTMARDRWSTWGMGWNTGPDVHMTDMPMLVDNYISCVWLFTAAGKNDFAHMSPAMGGARPRTAMGITEDDDLLLYCCSTGITPEDLRTRLAGPENCREAIMLDGGGSTQCDMGGGRRIVSTRRVHNYILVYLRDKRERPQKPDPVVHQYSKIRDGEKQLTANFKVREYGCRGSDKILIAEGLPELDQAIRDHFGRPVVISSGYRTAKHNAAVQGSPKSQHLLGTASDLHIKGVDPQEAARYAEYLLGDTGGIGLYPWGIHVDVRRQRSRWKAKPDGGTTGVAGFPGYVPEDSDREKVKRMYDFTEETMAYLAGYKYGADLLHRLAEGGKKSD